MNNKRYLLLLSFISGLLLCLDSTAGRIAAADRVYSAMFDQPAVQIGQEIARRFGCNWRQFNPAFARCDFKGDGLSVRFTIDPDTGFAKAIELNDLVTDPQTTRRRDQNTEQVARLVKYLLPAWPAQANWVKLALDEGWQRHAATKIKLGDLTLTSEYGRFQDIPVSGIYVTIGKSPP